MSILDADMADAITPQLIKPHPNTYTFTKCLGEHVMKTRTGEIPYSVVRPAIVTAAWKEPAGPTFCHVPMHVFLHVCVACVVACSGCVILL
jgi:hypothetical protein